MQMNRLFAVLMVVELQIKFCAWCQIYRSALIFSFWNSMFKLPVAVQKVPFFFPLLSGAGKPVLFLVLEIITSNRLVPHAAAFPDNS